MSGMVHEFDDLEVIDVMQEDMGFTDVADEMTVKQEYDPLEIDATDDSALLIEYVEEDEEEVFFNAVDDNADKVAPADDNVDNLYALAETLKAHTLVTRQQVSEEGVLENVHRCLECEVDYATPEEFAQLHHQMAQELIDDEDSTHGEQPWQVITKLEKEKLEEQQRIVNASSTSNNEFLQKFQYTEDVKTEAASGGDGDDDEELEQMLIKKEPSVDLDSDDGADKYFCCDCQVVFNDLESAEEHNCTATAGKAHTHEAELTKNYEEHLKYFGETQQQQQQQQQKGKLTLKIPKLTTRSSATKFETYNCSECDKSFSSIHALNSHNRMHKMEGNTKAPKEAEPIEAVCPICKTCFDSQKNLKLHMKIHGKKQLRSIEEALPAGAKSLYHEMNKFFCEICNKSFEQNLLGIHKNMHQQFMAEYNCPICNRHFENQISYDMHMQMHAEQPAKTRKPTTTTPLEDTNDTGDGKVKRFPCQYCERTFSRPFEKVRHERVHTGEKPHACEVCGKTFRVSYSLTLHLRTHTDIRPYVCPTCNKRFKSLPVYTHHLRIHQQERTYKCEQCQKTFRTSVQLSAHRKIHSKPYNCPVCNRPFASLYSVKIHMKTHNKLNKSSDDMKHTCWLCGAIYARVSALRYHMKEMHAVDMVSNEELESQQQSIVIKDDEIDDEAAVLIAAATEADCAAYMEASSASATSPESESVRTSSNADEVFQVMLQNDEIILYNYQTEEVVAD